MSGADEEDFEQKPTPAQRPAKRYRMTDSQRDRRHARSHPFGVQTIPDMVERELGGPGEIIGREVTEPWDLLDRDLDPIDREHVDRMRRDSDDPYRLVYSLSKELTRLKREDLSAQREQANQILQLIKHPPHEAVTKLQEQVADLERDISPIRRATKWAAGSVLAIAVACGAFLYSRGATEERAKARIETLERAVEDLHKDIRALRKGQDP